VRQSGGNIEGLPDVMASSVITALRSAATLALSTALSGARVVLIDCDFRRPTAAKLFRLTKAAGFADLLSTRAEWQEIGITPIHR